MLKSLFCYYSLVDLLFLFWSQQIRCFKCTLISFLLKLYFSRIKKYTAALKAQDRESQVVVELDDFRDSFKFSQ